MSAFRPWLPNCTRSLLEDSFCGFSCLGDLMRRPPISRAFQFKPHVRDFFMDVGILPTNIVDGLACVVCIMPSDSSHYVPRRSPESSSGAFWGLGHKITPGSLQEAHFGNFQAWLTKWPQKGPRRPPDVSICRFSALGHQMAPGAPRRPHFDHFRALTTKWLQKAPGSLILSIFGSWPANGSRRPL